MKRTVMLIAISMLCAAASAPAQTGGATGQTAGAADASTPVAQGSARAGALAAADAHASMDQMQQIVQRGAKVAEKSRARAEARMDKAASQVNAQANHGEQQVASRLATEFGMTADGVEAEKTDLATSWGQLMIAHTLAANANSGVTVQQLIATHAEGTGWGQIAAGMGLSLGEAVSAVTAEQRVADGQAKADGHVAVIHGQGSRAGVGTGVGINASGSPKGLGLGAGVGGGVKIGH